MESNSFYFSSGEREMYTHKFEIRKDGLIQLSDLSDERNTCQVYLSDEEYQQFIIFLKAL